MRFILILLLFYVAYKFLKPLLRKPASKPYVQGEKAESSAAPKSSENIEDAEFEEIN